MITISRMCRFTVIGLLILIACMANALCAEPNATGSLWPEGADKAVDMSDKKIAGQLEEVKGNVADLGSEDYFTSYNAYHRMSQQRTLLISSLVDLVNSDSASRAYGGPVHRAILLLGEMRSPEAVYALTKLLTFLPDTRSAMPTPREEYEYYFPAAEALAAIGQPAVSQMVNAISTSDDAKVRRLAVWVLIKIGGKDQAVFQLELKAAATTDKSSKQRLRLAVDSVKWYKPDRSSPYRLADK